ncbi:MAG: protein kinase, partial [Planctomycetales bacterium]|nr:protein kinase [Planctomycetales bacterium]
MSYSDFRREYLTQLPLPLAQLYRRTNDEKNPNARHNNCYFMFEALVKLVTAPAIAIYLEDAERSPQRRSEAIDKQLEALACPSQGHWVGMLRELARHFSQSKGAEVHPLGHLWGELDKRRGGDDFDGLVNLYRAIKEGPDSAPSGDQTCSLMDVVDKLVPYRNTVLGHGAQQSQSFYDRKAPLFQPAVNDALNSELLRKLWPQDATLIFIEEKREIDEDVVEVEYLDLTGERAVRMEPKRLSKSDADQLTVKRVALQWPGRSFPLRLDPLLIYRTSEQADEVCFLNKDVRGQRVEHLSYTTGKTHRDKAEMAAEMRKLVARIKGGSVSDSEIERITKETPEPQKDYVAVKAPKGRVIDDYEILVTLGKGGMGIVYLAKQLSLGRLVALKMLPAALAGDEEYLARFRREIRVLGQCEHPNIVKILAHGVSENEGPYYVMEYVPGCDLNELAEELRGKTNADTHISNLTSGGFSQAVLSATKKKRAGAGVSSVGSTAPLESDLTDLAADARIDSPEAQKIASESLPQLPVVNDDNSKTYTTRIARLMRDAALALHQVHEYGVVHRDIKPSNLMLTPDASRIVLMDFGLARLSDSDLTRQTQQGQLGTLRYMAPEQLQVRRLDHRVDVRALGVTLWELLSRRRLFDEIKDDEQLRSAILDNEPPKLRTIDSSIPRDLETIVAKAVEIKPDDRIGTASELAKHLDDFIHGRELTIRPRSRLERIWRGLAAHRIETAAALTVLVAIAVAAMIYRSSRNSAAASAADARAAVNELFVEVSQNDLLNRGGLVEVRNKLLKRAKAYYEKFQTAPTYGKDLRLDLAKTQFFIGEVTTKIEGYKKATEAYNEAMSQLCGVPDSVEKDEYMAKIWNRLGEARQNEARKLEAELRASSDAPDVQTRYDEAIAKYGDAREAYLDAKKLREELASLSPEDARLYPKGADRNSAEEQKKARERLSEFARLHANAIMNLAQLDSSVALFKYDWAKAKGGNQQQLATIAGGFKGVVQGLEDAQDLRMKLADEDLPDAVAELVSRDIAKGDINLSRTQSDWNSRVPSDDTAAEARARGKSAVDRLAGLLNDHPSNTEYQFLLGQAYFNVGSLSTNMAALHDAIQLFGILAEQSPSSLEYRRE